MNGKEVGSALKRRLAQVVDLDEDDCASLASVLTTGRLYDNGRSVIEEGDELKRLFVVAKGWAVRSRSLADGRRQIVNILLPGDCFDLQVFVSAKADHSVSAVTDITVGFASPRRVLDFFSKRPHIGQAFWWTAVQEEALLREQIVRIGAQTAYERVAHLLLDLHQRLRLIDEAGSDGFVLPLSQSHIADALGLSPVHVNRCLRRLIREEYISIQSRRVVMKNRDAMAALCQFHPRHLHLDAEVLLRL